MKVRIFRQRISQVHESEVEINDWMNEIGDQIEIKFIEQSAFQTDNTELAQPAYIISVWYEEIA